MELSNENETTHILRVIVRKAIEVPGHVHQIRRSNGGRHRLVHKSNSEELETGLVRFLVRLSNEKRRRHLFLVQVFEFRNKEESGLSKLRVSVWNDIGREIRHARGNAHLDFVHVSESIERLE